MIGATSGLDSFTKITGDDYAWGWNVGLMYSFNGDANLDNGAGRIGLAYRSKMKYDVVGSVAFTNPAVPTLTGSLAPFNPVVAGVSNTINQTRLYSGGVKLDVTMPDTASLSYYQKLNDKWDILGDITWTGWSSIQELRILRSDGSLLTVLPENFKDTWRFAAGVNYQYSDKVVLRAGVAYDQSPVNDTDRSARLPDNDRTWLTWAPGTSGRRMSTSTSPRCTSGSRTVRSTTPAIRPASPPTGSSTATTTTTCGSCPARSTIAGSELRAGRVG